MRNLFSRIKGQNIVEHLLIVTAVVVVLIVFLSTSGVFKGSLDHILNQPGVMIDRAAAAVH